jgi:hypothetical protein
LTGGWWGEEYKAGGAERFVEPSVRENRSEDIRGIISDVHFDESDYQWPGDCPTSPQ